MRSFCAATFIAVIILQSHVTYARTRYEVFDLHDCQQNAAVKTDYTAQPITADFTCAAFCKLREFPHGGCDCVTKKCVCANMNLNFCDFQLIRLFI